MKNLIRWGDRAGIAASAVCLVHCLLLPLAVLAFPLVGLDEGHALFHEGWLFVAAVPAVAALLPGYLRHRDHAVALAGAAGLALFALSVYVVGHRYGEAVETAVAVCGSVLLIAAHWRNRQRVKEERAGEPGRQCCAAH